MEKIKNEIKEYDEFVKNEIDENDLYRELEYDYESDDEFDCDEKKQYNQFNNYENYYNINIINFKVYFYFEINNYKYVFSIESDDFNIEKNYIYELLKNIVKIINNKNITIKYHNNNYLVSLKDIEDNDKEFYIKNYELKSCKKNNFYPKNDLPSYSSTILLKNIIKDRISFVSKNPLNIMLIQKYDDSFENKLSENKNNQNINTINKKFIQYKNDNNYKKNLQKNSCVIL